MKYLLFFVRVFLIYSLLSQVFFEPTLFNHESRQKTYVLCVLFKTNY